MQRVGRRSPPPPEHHSPETRPILPAHWSLARGGGFRASFPWPVSGGFQRSKRIVSIFQRHQQLLTLLGQKNSDSSNSEDGVEASSPSTSWPQVHPAVSFPNLVLESSCPFLLLESWGPFPSHISALSPEIPMWQSVTIIYFIWFLSFLEDQWNFKWV